MEKYIIAIVTGANTILIALVWKLIVNRVKSTSADVRVLSSKLDTQDVRFTERIAALDKSAAVVQEKITESEKSIQGTVKRFPVRPVRLLI